MLNCLAKDFLLFAVAEPQRLFFFAIPIVLHFVKKHATIVLLEKRQSIDLYGSVPSQNIGFLGTTSLTRLGRSFLGSTLTRRHTAEIIPPIKKPLIQPTVDEEQQHDSSQTLLPPLLYFPFFYVVQIILYMELYRRAFSPDGGAKYYADYLVVVCSISRCTGCPFDHSIPFLQSQELFPW
ncbi:amino acid transporter AVT1C [Trifolium repens]|nr:amino acid transporter AVT1C [Trifolium repens]